jgi:hypothetical protein
MWVEEHWRMVCVVYFVLMLMAWAFVYGAGRASGRDTENTKNTENTENKTIARDERDNDLT